MPDDDKKVASSEGDAPVAPVAADAPVAPPTPAPEGAPAETEGGDEEEGDDEEAAAADGASPEAILKRVSALEEEDAVERMARIEEEKLAARRKKERKGKKGGLEAAASKRLAKIGSKAPIKRSIATAVDADPLLDRATNLSRWAQKNEKAVRYGVLAALLAAAGAFGYVAYEHRREASASAELAKAVTDERGRIGDPDKEEDPDRPHDPRPIFKTNEDRREAALREYRDVEARYRGTGAAILARLSEGSLLLDKSDADGALTAYQEVSTSPLARADAEVRGRALEGMGFAYELKAEGQPADAQKPLLDRAAQEYRELENTDVLGFKEMGMYHQARIQQKEGDSAQAVESLKKLRERLAKPESEHSFVYLGEAVDEDLRSLDPTAAPPKPQQRPGARGGKNPYDEAQMKKIIEDLQRQAKEKGPMPAPPGPPPPSGATK